MFKTQNTSKKLDSNIGVSEYLYIYKKKIIITIIKYKLLAYLY